MNAATLAFQTSINASQDAIRQAECPDDTQILAFKDQVFDAISELARSIDDKDVVQLVMQQAISVHLFPTRAPGWQTSLMEQISSSVQTVHQAIAFLEDQQSEYDQMIMIAA